MGVFIYLGFLAFRRFWTDIENDLIVESQFVHPREYTHSVFWAYFVSRVLLRVAMMIVATIYIILLLSVLLPLWFQLFEQFAESPGDVGRILNAFLAWLGFILSIHTFAVIMRIFMFKERVFRG